MRDLGPRPCHDLQIGNGHSLCRDYSRSTFYARILDQLNECISLTNAYRTLHQFICRCDRVAEQGVQHRVPTDRSLTPLERFTWKKQEVIVANRTTKFIDKPSCSSCQLKLKFLLPLLNLAICSVGGRPWQHAVRSCAWAPLADRLGVFCTLSAIL